MTDFKERFIAEAMELLSKLEKGLLLLEVKPDNILLIEEIFRGLHTLKGSSAMYGFEKVGHLMHLIENVFEKVRSKQIIADNHIINLSLDVIDFTNKVFKLNEDVSLSAHNEYNALIERINQVTGTDVNANKETNLEVKNIDRNVYHTYFVSFTLDKDFEKRGIKLDAIFKELESIGSIISIPIKEKKDTLSSWEIFLISKSSLDDVEDVFIFMIDIAKIEKLGDENLFLNKEFNAIVQKNAAIKQRNNIAELKKAANPEKAENKEDKKQATADLTQQSNANFLRVAAEKLDEQMDLLSELVSAKAELRLIVEDEKYRKLYRLVESIDKITNRFRKNILNVRLVQVKTWYVMFLRLIRDISKQLNKNVEFVAEGLETEIDKNIIDRLESPLTHLIRNSLDHGIESSEERVKAGKNPKGTITLKASHSGSDIYIEIKDDGKGIDKEKIRLKAISKGLIEEGTSLTEKQIYDFIFLPGFSTAQNLSEVSGRGVGMDIVKKSINHLRGEIEVKSIEGAGTSVIIKLPMLLSIIDTLLIRSGEQYFAIPLQEVNKCTQLRLHELNQSVNNQLAIEGELIPYIYLRHVFGINNQEPEKQRIVIIKGNNKKVGLIADEVIGEYQAVLKPFDGYYINNQYFIGASLLADGHLSVILDTSKLIEDKLK